MVKYGISPLSEDDNEAIERFNDAKNLLTDGMHRAEEAVLLKAFERHKGRKPEPEDYPRITKSVINNDFLNYQLHIDGIPVGIVHREIEGLTYRVTFKPTQPPS